MPDDAGFTKQFSPVGGGFAPIWVDDSGWDESAIPARNWVAPGYLLRGHVTAVVGPPGVSKSTLMIAYAVALALNIQLHGLRPAGACRVMIYNAEDDQDEQRRRLSAILTSHGRRPEHVASNILRVGPAGAATLLTRDPDSGEILNTPAMTALVDAIERHRPDVLILDPLSEMHSEEENANVAMREVVAIFRKLAKAHDLALVLVHHTRKGPVTPGDMDSGRGASSISGAARIVLTVAGMTEDEAKAFGLPADHRKHFFRVDGAKSNYAPLADAEWFERCQYQLENGDGVAIPKPWQPPTDAANLETTVAIEAAVAVGSGVGPWSIKLSDDPRSIRRLLEQHGIRTPKGQRDTVAGMLSKGFVEAEYKNHNRVKAKGLRAPDGRPASVLWQEVAAQ